MEITDENIQIMNDGMRNYFKILNEQKRINIVAGR